MNKTVTANISGVVFHIETDAYEKLHQYLNTIRNYFRDSDGTDEIMADIEARIAELFKENLDAGKDVITMVNVQGVIEIMGEPEQYMDEESTESYSEPNYSSRGSNFKSRKLFRDPDDNVLGGVCSGLGYYFGIDRIWLRIAFLIALFGFGSGILLYIILWIIIPDAKNTAEKLEMKGEPINVQNIGNTIKDEFGNFKKKVDNSNPAQYGRKAENFLYKFFDFIGKILLYFFKFIGVIIGGAFVLAALIGIFTFLVALIGGPFNFNIDNANFSNVWTTDMAEIFFSSANMFYTGLAGVILVTIIPLLGLLFAGLKIIFKIPTPTKAIGISSISLFVLGVILIFFSATATVAQYSNEQKMTETIVLEEFESDTLIFSSLENTYSNNHFGGKELFIDGDKIYSDDISVDVVQSKEDMIELKLMKSSKGRNRKEAGKRAENTMMRYDVEGNKLKVSPLISIPFDDKFRDQYIRASISLPVGKTIFLSRSSREIIYDIENVSDTYDGKMIGHYWLMTEEGLTCTDCEWLIEEEDDDTDESTDKE